MSEEDFLALAKAKYAEIHALKDKPTLMEYEQGLVEIWQELGRQVAEANLGEVSKDRRKKRDITPPSGKSS